MNKKHLIIIAVALVLIQTFAYYSLASKNSIDPVSAETNVVSLKDLNNASTLIKPAVEYYLTQNETDSMDQRNERLSLYFSGDSPIFTNPVSNMGQGDIKTVTSVSKIALSDKKGEYQNVLVWVSTKYYTTDTDFTSSNDIYVVELIKTTDGSYAIYNIGKSE